jgi:hypothetical protein
LQIATVAEFVLAVKAMFPDSTAGMEIGELVRSLFLHLGAITTFRISVSPRNPTGHLPARSHHERARTSPTSDLETEKRSSKPTEYDR